jgi:cobalamin biosynthesis protein CobD/CbiB
VNKGKRKGLSVVSGSSSCPPAAALPYDLTVFQARSQHNLSVERVRSRVGAYIYGNIIVLAAILATSPESIAHWTAFVIVVATSATTFFAHVVAHNIGQAIGRTDDEDLRVHLAQEARDAVPIMVSALSPPCS